MDVSDGLAGDMAKLCRSSGVSARLFAERIPVHPLLRQTFPDAYLDLALNGGEDYLLLFTATPDVMERVMPQLSELSGGAAIVGEIIPGEPGLVSVVDQSGAETVAGRGGWDHVR